MAIQQFRLPDPGEGLVEAEIVSWRVAVGDTVAVNDILVEVETSKSLVELPSPYAGTVAALLASEGETVDVGKPIIAIDDGVEQQPPEPQAPSEDMVPELPAPEPEGEASAGGRVPVLVGYGPRTTETRRRPRKSAAAAGPSGESHAQAADAFSVTAPVSRRADDRTPLQPQPAQPVGGPLPSPGSTPVEPAPAAAGVLAKPPVRRLARDMGVDLRLITGSGDGGVITRDDVERAASLTSPAPVQPGSPSHVGREDIRIPIKGVRKATAQAMSESAFTAPHVTEWLTCDVSATVELVERLKTRREFAGVRVSPLLIIAKAVCLALRRTPELNSTWDAAAGEIVLKGTVNLGVATATPRGLVVPNVKDAGSLGLVELAEAINAMVTTARDGKAQPADLSQGTFTITNVGVFGVDAGTPILNPGESGILCVGQIARRPWVVGSGSGERIEPRWVITLAVSFDHRLADGEQGSRFLTDVAGVVSDPGLALLF